MFQNKGLRQDFTVPSPGFRWSAGLLPASDRSPTKLALGLLDGGAAAAMDPQAAVRRGAHRYSIPMQALRVE